jgi:hypothetical protein
LSQSSSLHDISSLGFSYNADDQILGEQYDANGNTTATGGKTFAYDSENHLVSMNGGAVSMVYEGDGNRVVKDSQRLNHRCLIDERRRSPARRTASIPMECSASTKTRW